MTEFLKTLLLLSASGSALGLVLLLGRRISGKRLPSTLWYYAWLPVLLRLVLPLPGLIPTAQEAVKVVPSPVAQTESTGPRSYHYNDNEVVIALSGNAGEEAETPVLPAATVETVTETEETPSAPSRVQAKAILRSPALWLGIWVASAVLCISRYTAGYVRFRRVLMETLQTTDGPTARVYASFRMERKPKLFRSAYVMTPMLLGLGRPLIVLPDGTFSEESARNVLRHELTHYRRGDLYVKWLFVLIASLHWFNPLMPLFRRELDRVCELSCDENVLARMEPSKRHSYGETLLDLAENRALPAGVVATTFATEKRALKERLEQIMQFKYKPRAIIALTIAALLLMGLLALAAAPARASAPSADAPQPTPMPPASAEASGEASGLVSADVDEFLAAIAPNATVALTPGLYDLSQASDYGRETDSEYYRWEEVHDGYELVIENVENLTIASTVNDASATVISAVPRYADVLAFRDCRNITLSGFTAGHTVEQGQCAGGVIHLLGTDDVSISGCALYGCGVLGVEAENCRNLLVSASDIYECSNGAVWLTSCNSVQFDRCSFRDCYNRYGETSPAFQIFKIDSCYGVAITDGHVYGNFAGEFVHVSYSQEVYLLGTLFEDNEAMREDYLPNSGTVLSVTGDPITVAGCEFRDSFPVYAVSETSPVVDMGGNALNNDDLAAMKQEAVAFPGFAEYEVPELDRRQGENGMYAVYVSTVDELLAAIAPNTTIYLDEGLYDLSQASTYGAYGGQYYYWNNMFDGPELVISGVDNLSIEGPGTDAVRIEALPRCASVLRFDDCQNVAVRGLTAGHTLGAGMCSGPVLDFKGCEGIDVKNCGLFGCGIYGIQASECSDLTAEGNEIYECSYGAVQLGRCANVVFADNDIHDCAYPTYRFGECLNVTIDGEAVEEEAFDGNEEYLGFAEYASQEADAGDAFMQAVTQRGTIIFTAFIDIPGAGPYASPNAQG